jgi:hypothetical protein
MANYPTGVHTSGLAQYPYDDPTMTPFSPDAQKRMADRAALIAGSGIGYAADTTARDAIVTNGDAFTGLHVYVASVDQVQKYTGSGWVAVFGTPTSQTVSGTTGTNAVSVASESYCNVLGKSVELHFAASRSGAAIVQGLQLGSIPAAVAPPSYVRVVGQLTTGSQNGLVGVLVNPDGTITTSGYITNTSSSSMGFEARWRLA